MPDTNKPVANALVILREEFDDWAVLFDPDTGNAFGLNPVGVFIWKRLDGQHSVEKILEDLRHNCIETPDDAEAHFKDFVQSLVEQGLAGFEYQKV